MFRGRRKILSECTRADVLDVGVLMGAINTAFMTHRANKAEIDYLVNYKNGRQTILDKEKRVRPEINNKFVINHAQMITRMVTGYFLGTPIQYVQSGAEKKAEIDILNRYLQYEDKSTVDSEVAEYQSICGTAYRIVFTDGVYGDEVPFEDKCLDPSNTFVVYENSIAENPLFGVTYHSRYDQYGNPTGFKIYCYTEYGQYVFVTDTDYVISNDYSFSPYNIGGVPIIEYPNNVWRIGDWELCIDLMDAINALQNGRMDDIDQMVQSLLVFINADVGIEQYDEMREGGVISLKNTTNSPSSVEILGNPLDQSGMNMYAKELEELLYALLGIPDRNNRSSSGGDTGAAVELRDGWADLEIVARNKENCFSRSEKMFLKIVLNILNNKEDLGLSLLDVNIKFSRNKNNNMLSKTQAYSNLIATKTLDPADCLTIVDLVSDVNDYIIRGKTFWGDDFAQKETQSKSFDNQPFTDTKNISTNVE